MWLIKIDKQLSKKSYSAFWQDQPKNIPFSRQSSDAPVVANLIPGTVITVNTEAVKGELLENREYVLNGSIINFTKKNPPELVLCVTSVNTIIKQ